VLLGVILILSGQQVAGGLTIALVWFLTTVVSFYSFSEQHSALTRRGSEFLQGFHWGRSEEAPPASPTENPNPVGEHRAP